MNESVYKNYSGTSNSIIVIANCLINIPLMLAAILGNSLVLAAILTSSSLRSRASMILLSSLAVSDLAVGLITQPFYIAQELSSNELITKLSYTMSMTLIGISLASMALISVDRVLTLQCHMSYDAVVTTPRVIFAIVFIWLLHFFVSSIVRLLFTKMFTYTVYVLLGLYNAVSIISYINIYRIVRRHQLQIQSQQQAVQDSSTETNIHNIVSVKYTALNTFVFYMCACFCYFPRVIYFLSRSGSSNDSNTPWVFTATLIFANSAINPLLFCWRLRELRIAVKSTLIKISCKQQANNN